MQSQMQQHFTLPEFSPLVSRDHSLNLLHQSLIHFPLVVVQAPSGYGKTLLIREYVEYLNTQASHYSHNLHYLNCQEDMSFDELWQSIMVLLKRFDYGLGEKLFRDWEKSDSSEQALNKLLNRLKDASSSIHRQGELTLVIDSGHYLNAEHLISSIRKFIEAKPSWIKLVICSRANLNIDAVNLMAKRQCKLIQCQDLAFTSEQSKQCISQQLNSDLTIDSQLAFKLSQGWPAIINLLSVNQEAINGSNTQNPNKAKLNLGFGSLLYDFIKPHIIDQQSRETQSFLNGLCHLESFHLTLLKQLAQQGLFSEVDVQGQYQQLLHLGLIQKKDDQYQQLHPVLRHFYLQNSDAFNTSKPHTEITCSNSSSLKQTAKNYFISNDCFDAALALCLEMEDWQQASNLALKTSQQYLNNGDMAYVQHLLDHFPQSFIYQQPFLCLLKALIHISQYEHNQAKLFMDNVQSQIENLPDHEPQQLIQLGIENQEELKTLLQAHQILNGLMQRFSANYNPNQFESNHGILLNSSHFLCWQYYGQAVDSFIQDDMKQCVSHANNALLLAKDIEDLSCVVATSGWLLHALYYQGQVTYALNIAQDTLHWLHNRNGLEVNNIHNLYGAMCFLCIENNDLDLAWQYFEKIKKSVGPFSEPRELLYNRYFLHMILLGASHQYEALNTALDELKQFEVSLQQKSLQGDFSILFDSQLSECLLELRNKNAFPLMQWAMSSSSEFEDFDDTQVDYSCLFRYHYESFLFALGKSLGGMEMGDYLDALKQKSLQSGAVHRSVSIDFLRARLHFGKDEMEACERHLYPGLQQGKISGYLHAIIEDSTIKPLLEYAIKRNIEAQYAQTLLDALMEREQYCPPWQKSLAEDDSLDAVMATKSLDGLASLTPRETEVLLALAKGKRNKDLAEDLNLSLATVKRHLQNIYGKLQVTSRTEAVLLAQPLITTSES